MHDENEISAAFMQKAIEQAEYAYSLKEVPIGAVVVYDGQVIGAGCNLRNTYKNPLYHSEIIAINQACKVIGDWRLEGCQIYVTVEPCPMCAGAIVTARMDKLVYGAKNPKAGCCGSILNITNEEKFNHRVLVESGVLEEQCANLMKRFFSDLRNTNNMPYKEEK